MAGTMQQSISSTDGAYGREVPGHQAAADVVAAAESIAAAAASEVAADAAVTVRRAADAASALIAEAAQEAALLIAGQMSVDVAASALALACSAESTVLGRGAPRTAPSPWTEAMLDAALLRLSSADALANGGLELAAPGEQGLWSDVALAGRLHAALRAELRQGS